MTTHKSKSLTLTKSPTQAESKPAGQDPKLGDGDVKLPNDAKSTDEKNQRVMNYTNGASPSTGSATTGLDMKSFNTPSGKLNEPNGIIIALNGGPSNSKTTQALHGAKLSVKATAFKPKPAPLTPMYYLNRGSSADDSKPDDSGPLIVSSDVTSKTTHDNGKGKAKATQEPIGTRGDKYSPTRKVFFTTDVGPNVVAPGGHYIKVANIRGPEIPELMKALYSNHNWAAKLRGEYCPARDGFDRHDMFFALDDTRDATAAFHEINMINTNVDVNYVGQPEYLASSGCGKGSGQPSSYFDGQVLLHAQFEGLTSEMDASNLFKEVEELAKGHGDVLAFTEKECGGSTLQFRAEYYKISAAKKVAETLTKSNPKHLGKWTIYAEEILGVAGQGSPTQAIYKLENDAQCMSTPQKFEMDPNVIRTSPTGRTAWRYNENGEAVPVPPPKQLPKTYTNQTPWGVPQHPRHMSDPLPETPVNGFMVMNDRIYPNSWSAPSGQSYPYQDPQYSNTSQVVMHGSPTSVDVNKIMNGQDVRTTVMLRNLPNGVNYNQMKGILDAVCFGRYDFSYLRIDFSNNNNVGYGFVNFTDPMYIVHLVNYYVGRPWIPDYQKGFNKGKKGPRIAGVSYATIQGYDCLVEKFRNSAVLDEFQDHRPKLWWTYDNAVNHNLIGTEMNFPEPNNPSKHQRSRDNATQVGLYTSGNRRNRNANGKGNRRSQWDRGTSAQIREDGNYNQQFMSPGQNAYGFAGPNYMIGGPPMSIGPPPPFPIMPTPGVNGFVMPNAASGVQPCGYGTIQFTDPFVSNSYPSGQHMPNGHQMNGPFNGQPNNLVQTPTNGHRFFQSGVDFNRIPKAIAEEDGSAEDTTTYPNNHQGNGNVRTFGSQY